MFSKLYGLVAIISVALLLAGSGFVGYLLYADKLTVERLELVASVLRGELDDALEDEEAQPAGDEQTPGGRHAARSASEIDDARRHQQMQSAVLDRSADDAAARQTLLDQTLAHLVGLQEQFQTEKAEWVKQKETLAADARDRGFRKELDYVKSLSSKQAKEHIVRTWRKNKADVVRIFMAIPTRQGKTIMAQLKTPSEMDLLHELLEQLRLQDVEGLAAESRRSRGDG
ncbi:MAG: hypothetical protein IID33_02315 [Planctomycetes bacterium]|nr:hypothetical protein [Planctomycetota bacterium]